jgi:hypothetical protein
MPVMAATRAERFSARAICPTPRPRTIDTARAAPLASTTPAEAASRTGSGSITCVPTYQAPAAMARYTPRMSQP